MRGIKSRLLSGLVMITLLLSMFTTIKVYASAPPTGEKDVNVTNEIAKNMAQNFVEDISPDLELVADDPVKIYDTTNQAIGYIVSFYNSNTPYGYVIFDAELEEVISEYCIGENALSPYEVACQESGGSAWALQEKKAYKLDPMTYGVDKIATDEITTNYGDELKKEDVMQEDHARSVISSSWNEIFIGSSAVYGSYNILESNYLDMYCTLSESYVKSMTGKYACAVSAMSICADYYGFFDYGHFARDYVSLWSLSNTSVHNTDDGIEFGVTQNNNVGPAFHAYAATKGESVSYNHTLYANHDFFKGIIDDGNIGIMQCAIWENGERSGHAMAVEGYSVLERKDNG